MSKLLSIKQYEEGDVVFDANDPEKNRNLIMVLSGAIRCKSNGSIIRDYEIIYKDDSMTDIFEDELIAENFTITAEITAFNIKKHFGSEISEIIDRSKKIKIIKSIYLFSLFSEDDLLKILSQ